MADYPSKGRALFAAFHFYMAFLLMTGGIVSLFGQQYDTDRDAPRVMEHRLTSLEGSVQSLADDMHTIKQRGSWDWIQQICLALLVGERGNDVLRRKSKPQSEG